MKTLAILDLWIIIKLTFILLKASQTKFKIKFFISFIHLFFFIFKLNINNHIKNEIEKKFVSAKKLREKYCTCTFLINQKSHQKKVTIFIYYLLPKTIYHDNNERCFKNP